jgi:hypothetical protein
MVFEKGIVVAALEDARWNGAAYGRPLVVKELVVVHGGLVVKESCGGEKKKSLR